MSIGIGSHDDANLLALSFSRYRPSTLIESNGTRASGRGLVVCCLAR